MKYILGKKVSMTQIFSEKGDMVPVTVVQAGPCVVTQIKGTEKDGYTAVQIAYGHKNKLKKPQKGHFKELGSFRYVREFRSNSDVKVGDQITVGTFAVGDKVKVTGTSKGRGFQGVVKRHGFGGAKASHGTKDQLRMPGSIGATGPAHVFKGMRMPGQMGDDRVTIANLEIIQVDSQENLLYIKGAIPGARNSLVMVYGDGELKISQEEVVKESEQEGVHEELQVGIEAKKENSDQNDDAEKESENTSDGIKQEDK